MENGSLILWIVALLLVAAGIAGMVVPALPGIVLLFLGLVVAAWADGFIYVGGGTIVLLGVLALAGYALDFLAGALGATVFGAGKPAVFGAVAGTVAGMFFGLPGLIAGPFLGAFAAELIVRRNLFTAGLSGFGAWIGMVVGTAAKVAVAAVMIAVFVIARFF